MPMTQQRKQDLEEIAYRVIQHVETAVSEIAYQIVDVNEVRHDVPDDVSSKLSKSCKRMKRDGKDWRGFLADELFNHKGLCTDIATDTLYDLVFQSTTFADRKATDGQVPQEYIDHAKQAFNKSFHLKLF